MFITNVSFVSFEIKTFGREYTRLFVFFNIFDDHSLIYSIWCNRNYLFDDHSLIYSIWCNRNYLFVDHSLIYLIWCNRNYLFDEAQSLS